MKRFAILALCVFAQLAVAPVFADEAQPVPNPTPTQPTEGSPAPAPTGGSEPDCN